MAARRIFSEASYRATLCRIVLHCIEEYSSLSLVSAQRLVNNRFSLPSDRHTQTHRDTPNTQVCRNVRALLQTDPVIRDRLFQLMYSLPLGPPSLDGPLPSRPNDPRTPPDTEAFLREQALQRFSPSLVRCVHAGGPVAAVRDGYMVTLGHKATAVSPGTPSAAGDKHAHAQGHHSHPTGWVVWALPLWHEVRRATVTKRDESKPVRGDPLDPRDVPLPPRPSGACKDQSMWMWEFELGKEIAAVAIQPEDNLIAVAVAP